MGAFLIVRGNVRTDATRIRLVQSGAKPIGRTLRFFAQIEAIFSAPFGDLSLISVMSGVLLLHLVELSLGQPMVVETQSVGDDDLQAGREKGVLLGPFPVHEVAAADHC